MIIKNDKRDRLVLFCLFISVSLLLIFLILFFLIFLFFFLVILLHQIFNGLAPVRIKRGERNVRERNVYTVPVEYLQKLSVEETFDRHDVFFITLTNDRKCDAAVSEFGNTKKNYIENHMVLFLKQRELPVEHFFYILEVLPVFYVDIAERI